MHGNIGFAFPRHGPQLWWVYEGPTVVVSYYFGSSHFSVLVREDTWHSERRCHVVTFFPKIRIGKNAKLKKNANFETLAKIDRRFHQIREMRASGKKRKNSEIGDRGHQFRRSYA